MAMNYTDPDRTVKLNLNSGQMTGIAMEIGNWEKLWHALGYLSTWNTTYPVVEIFQDGKTDLVAIYKDADDKTGYVIGAVWHDTHYGFHS